MVTGMKVEELKDYLRLRGLKISGKKAELVARVFAASENNVKPIKSAAEVQVDLRNEYQAKLLLGDYLVPDPYHLKEGWLSEENGIVLWPVVTYPEIYNYFMFHPSELCSSDLNDYKNSKGYSYFKRGWIGQISYHSIHETSNFCILKTDCRASERLRDPPHKLWACISKKDSTIKSAHCDCMAGMSGTCLHVAAMFYRVEAAVRLGLTNPSCTEKSCHWLPNRSDVVYIYLLKLRILNSVVMILGKRGKKTRKLVPTPKKLYNPINDKNVKPIKLIDIAEALENVHPLDRILSTAIPKPEIDFFLEVIEIPAKPENVESIDDILSKSENAQMFYKNLSKVFNSVNLEQIEHFTRGQSSNESWFVYRKGVISGSKGHNVKTKMEKLKKGGGCGNVNLWQVFQKISGLVFVNPNIPALKYGRSMETNAANEFYEQLSESHKNLKVSECGLFLDKNHPFIGASPDRIVTCDCCPKACLEVKCPYSINYTSPDNPDINLPYLKKDDGKLKLNDGHNYYTQCQMQMGVTGCSHCYFFVWTQHGFVLDTLHFDPEFWQYLKNLFIDFYELYLKSVYC